LAAVANSGGDQAAGVDNNTASHRQLPTSAMTMTRRRSNRSLSRPDTGPTRPTIPAEATSAAETHAAESVSSKMV
jgi:hypothetical protein